MDLLRQVTYGRQCFVRQLNPMNHKAKQSRSVQSIMGATDTFRDIDRWELSVIF